MTKEEEEVNATKISKFSGEKDDWSIWKAKFLARARRVGYKDVLLGLEPVPTDKEVKTTMAKLSRLDKDQVDLCKKKRRRMRRPTRI